jgi:hypothetical protein
VYFKYLNLTITTFIILSVNNEIILEKVRGIETEKAETEVTEGLVVRKK